MTDDHLFTCSLSFQTWWATSLWHTILLKHLSTISQWLPLNVGFFAARDRLAMSFPKLRRRPTAFYLISQLVAGPVPFMVTSIPTGTGAGSGGLQLWPARFNPCWRQCWHVPAPWFCPSHYATGPFYKTSALLWFLTQIMGSPRKQNLVRNLAQS